MDDLEGGCDGAGRCTVQLNAAKFEIVGQDVPTTGRDMIQKRDKPMNLDFEQ
jgi:hypothetical protein